MRWEVVRTLPGDSLLVRYALVQHPDVVWFAREVRTGDDLRPLCGCEHLRPEHAEGCYAAERGLRVVESERTSARIAALPSLAGALFATHCNTYWRASGGGACPVCGAPGAALVPEVEIEDNRAGRWTTVNAQNVGVVYALHDAGLTAATARALGEMTGHVPWPGAETLGATLADRLTAKGWRVTRTSAAKRRKAADARDAG